MEYVVSKRFDDLGKDGEPVRLGIMGGTFNPIHVGHVRIAEELRERLSLDAVLFIPTGNPVFKRDQKITDARHRLEMCKRAVLSNPHFDVSTIEIDREGDTYTVDTLHQLRSHYPDNVEFFLMLGSDSAATIGKWRGSDELAQICHLAVAAGRPGSVGEDELIRSIESAGSFKYDVVRTSVLEVSSNAVREKLSTGQSVRYILPVEVLAYIRENKLYMPEADADEHAQADEVDPLSKAFYKARREELRERVSPKRFKHIMGVSEAAGQLAECYGVDVKKARLAGLLHDWDKGYDDEGARQRVYELGMEDEVDPAIVENMPHVLHGWTAARALGREYPCIPRDVLQAIERHTTAAETMTPLDMVLYIADAVEPGRKFGRIDELRSLVGKASLEELYFKTYEYWVFLLFERRKPLHPDTIRIWNAYTASRKGESRQKAPRD